MKTRMELGKTGKIRKFNQEALAKVEANSGKILSTLLKAIAEGNVLSTLLMAALAEATAEKEGESNNMKLAIDLASEPQWPDGVPREDDAAEDDADEAGS